MSDIERVDAFLSEAKLFYLTTVDGDKPKCRPMGLHTVIDGKLYMGVGTFKEVYRQMQANPYVEVCATNADKDFIRYYGKAVFETSDAIAEQVLAASPVLRQIYNQQSGYKLGIFHLEEATAEFRGMLSIKESIKF